MGEVHAAAWAVDSCLVRGVTVLVFRLSIFTAIAGEITTATCHLTHFKFVSFSMPGARIISHLPALAHACLSVVKFSCFCPYPPLRACGYIFVTYPYSPVRVRGYIFLLLPVLACACTWLYLLALARTRLCVYVAIS